jgi:hypothetical protein
MIKLNCWEFKNCGREPGGKNAETSGVCPATAENRLHGVHDGTNAGRACWILAGTLCGGSVQGHFGEKYKNCRQCAFYAQVKSEEGMNFTLSPVLISKISDIAQAA